jgi:hypothetical protein
MGGIKRVCAPVVVLIAGLASTPGNAAIILESLTVRVYDNAGILAGDRARAIKRANDILSRADLAIVWRDCSIAREGVCATAPSPGELAVRLVRAPRTQPNDRALGSAMIDTTTGTGTLATIFVDRVEQLARAGRAETSAMVGRVMAHEIGHLLLGTTTHTHTGLMREIWTTAELTRDRPGDWVFSPVQKQQLRHARSAGALVRAGRAGGRAGG